MRSHEISRKQRAIFRRVPILPSILSSKNVAWGRSKTIDAETVEDQIGFHYVAGLPQVFGGCFDVPARTIIRNPVQTLTFAA
jgi:hypothetical protein